MIPNLILKFSNSNVHKKSCMIEVIYCDVSIILKIKIFTITAKALKFFIFPTIAH
ncbi:hypothetical protein KFK09_019675 [Dendrobium nobile]|uniref:Uncharacterized protein n=1 Tax=Dendrobium nobile TaxID=94219 RepID=A0A8T3ASV7_DENNO|nr:hypothetical protein KFK09_019675 [Dendrobium nobile]